MQNTPNVISEIAVSSSDRTALLSKTVTLENGNAYVVSVFPKEGTDNRFLLRGQMLSPEGEKIGEDVALDFPDALSTTEFDLTLLDNGKIAILADQKNVHTDIGPIEISSDLPVVREFEIGEDGVIVSASTAVPGDSGAARYNGNSITSLEDGEYIVFNWHRTFGIPVVGFNPSNGPVFPTFGEDDIIIGDELLHVTLHDNDAKSDMITLKNGNIVAVLNRSGDERDDDGQLEYLVYDPDGTPIKTDGVLGSSSNAHQHAIVQALETGGFVIAYTENDDDRDIRFRVFDESGNPVSDVETILFQSDIANSHDEPAIAPLEDGGFILFYDKDNGTPEIRGQRFDANGDPVGEDFLVASENGKGLSAASMDGSRVVVTFLVDGVSRSVVVSVVEGQEFTGTEQNDVLIGGDGDDVLDGGAGDDVLNGRFGDNTLTGGSGSDRFVIDSPRSTTVITDFNTNRNTGDLIELISSSFKNFDEFKAAISDDGGDAVIRLDEYRTITLQGVSASALRSHHFNFVGSEEDETMFGTSKDDVLGGGAGDDILNGREGNDILAGGAGDDFVAGETGDDTLFGDAGNDQLEGGLGKDELHGGSGEDELNGGFNDDLLFGNDGDDVLTGEAGADILNGGAGNDELSGGQQHDQLFGGLGDDTLDGGTGDDVLFGNEGDDKLIGAAGNDELNGGAGDDQFFGGAGADTLRGDDGHDSLFGGDDNDLLKGGLGDDQLFGGAGNDFFIAGEGNDVLSGGHGKDFLQGNDGDDQLNGDGGNDQLFGGKGADRLHGGLGDDDLAGGAGDDTFIFQAHQSGHDAVEDFIAGAGTDDVIQFSGSAFADFEDVLAAASETASGTLITVNETTSITLEGVQLSDLHRDDFAFA